METQLRQLLSQSASLSNDPRSAPRWSDYKAPRPGLVVNVAEEHDVQVTVQWCLENKKPFLAQSGGHGWQDASHIGENGIIINMRGLNSVQVSDDKKSAHVGGGAVVSEVIEAAYAADVQMLTGNCNSAGMIGSALGGGYGFLQGQYGLSIDNMISLNVVLANGEFKTVTPKDSELWWALRGAGSCFGVITSAQYKAHYVPQAKNVAWTGAFVFTPDKLEEVAKAVEEIVLEPSMALHCYFVTTPPHNAPMLLIVPFYLGGLTEARAAFKSFLEIGPVADTTALLPYNQWNAGGEAFNVKGGRRPAFGVGFSKMDPTTCRQIFAAYAEFASHKGAQNSAILIEAYPLWNPIDPGTNACFANRHVRFNAVILPVYDDPSLDTKAADFGRLARQLLQARVGYPENRKYVNFANGDESPVEFFGSNLPRLRQLKRVYDPQHVLYHWLDLS